MKDRLKALRKSLGLTQQAFGERLGVKQNTVAQYEIGRTIPSSPIISAICKEYNVNEHWLRTGEGEMFMAMSHEEEIGNFLSDLITTSDSNFKKRLILYLAQMQDSGWEKLEQVLDMLLEGKNILFPDESQDEQQI